MSSSRTTCVTELLPNCNSGFSPSIWRCGGEIVTRFAYNLNGGNTLSDHAAIQHHIDSILALGDNYDCQTNSFASGSYSAQNLYRYYIWDNPNVVVGYGVQHGCGGFRIWVLLSPYFSGRNDPVSSCPSDPCGSCEPNSCSAALTCHLDGENDGCYGTMSCPCPGGQTCINTSCCQPETCVGKMWNCGEVEAGCGRSSEDCGSCLGDDVCYMMSGETGGRCCTPRTCEEVGCGVIISAADNCGIALNCDSTIELGCGTGAAALSSCGGDGDCGPGEECMEDGTCMCPSPCPTESCGVYSNACQSENCGACIEGFMCDVMADGGGVCVPDDDCCTCPDGTTWNGIECEVDNPGGRTCNGNWEETSGFVFYFILFIFFLILFFSI